MDPSMGKTAAQFVNDLPEGALAELFERDV